MALSSTVKPRVSIVIPCRNERGHMGTCLASTLNQMEPAGGFEVIVADGMSDDGTREILEKIVAGRSPVVSSLAAPILHPSSFILHPSPEGPVVPVGSPSTQADRSPISHLPTSHPNSPVVRVIDNPGRIVSTGLNAAIRAARGDIIVRMDAHTQYAPDYLARCVQTLEETGADNVGGPWVARGGGYISQAIAAAFQSPFAVGSARGHDPSHEGEVDTVYLGCWPRSTFEKFGLFDEELVRNQDDEHNLRITRGGGKVYQSPKIKSWYRPRGTLAALFKQYMQYGYWKVRVIQKHKLPASIRHLVPGAFVLLLLLLSLCSLLFAFVVRGPWSVIPLIALCTLLFAYALGLLVASVVTAAKTEWNLLPVLPLVFGCYHFGYGFGFLRGILDFVIFRSGPSASFTKLTCGSSETKAAPASPKAPQLMNGSQSQGMPTVAPRVSVIVPCRNESSHIATCVAGLLALEVPAGGFEVVVADGRSDDGTRKILEQLAGKNSRLKVIDNPGLTAPCGLNAAIHAARGGIIVRADAHTEYAPDYLLRCLEVLQQTGADNVGGPWVARGGGYISQAIAAAFQSPFAVGGARAHNAAYEGPIDTVYLGCWRKEAFAKFGYFDEELVRNQDDEYNLRIKRGGGKVYQSPKIKSWYRPRGTLAALFKQYMQYGYWKVRVIQKHKLPASWRHLVPGAFLLTLAVLFPLSVFSFLLSAFAPNSQLSALRIPISIFSFQVSAFSFSFLAALAAYALCVLVASVVMVAKIEWKLLPVLPLVFGCYHFGYGLGFLRGILDFVILRRGASVSFTKLTRGSSEAKAAIRSP
jgi:glycosyltransferase involved in cell wall biosynthesis